MKRYRKFRRDIIYVGDRVKRNRLSFWRKVEKINYDLLTLRPRNAVDEYLFGTIVLHRNKVVAIDADPKRMTDKSRYYPTYRKLFR